MAALAPRPSRTQRNSRPTPPDLVLQESNTNPSQSQRFNTLSSSNSSSSLKSQLALQQQQKQSTSYSPDPPTGSMGGPFGGGPRGLGSGAGGAAGGAPQFQPYTAHYSSYRPYTPTTPTTPTALHGMTMPMSIPIPLTPTFGGGFGHHPLPSPRLDYSSSLGSSSGNASNSLNPYSMAQRASSTRRMPSNESSLYDPYRSRQPGISANRVKNEYQAHSPIRENQGTLPQQPQPYYAGQGSSEKVNELHQSPPAEDHVFGVIPLPLAVGQREDLYRQSPTLAASQTLAASYGNTGVPWPESPLQPHMAYQPYSSQQQLQHPLPSPSIIDPYRTSSPAYSSPGLSPLHTGGHSVYDDLSMPIVQVRSEHTKVDPYRSAYSQSANNHASNNTSHPYGSSYQGSGRGSPNPNEDFSSSFESRFSSMSTQQLQQQNASSNTVTNSNNNNNPRYPRDLVGQDSIYKAVPLSELTAQLPAPPEKAATISSDRAVTASASDKDLASTSVNMSAGQTRPPTLNPSRPSKSDTSGTTKKTTTDEEDEENDVILQKLGVLSADSSGNGSRSGTRSGITYGSGRSRRKGQWTDESEEESQDRRSEASRPQLRRLDRRGTASQRRRRDAQRRCLCCSARVCLYITFALFICVATALYFIIPRSPAFGFESVAPLGPPVVTTNRIQEPFTVQLMVDSRSNYLPIRLNSIDLSILLKMDQSKIANNDNLPSAFVIQPRMAQIISIPMTLDYNSVGSDQNTDSTLQLLVAACKPFDPVDTNSVVPSIDLTVSGSLHVWGLSWVWKPSFDFNVDRVPCPANTKDLGGQTSTSVPSAPVQPVPSATAFVASAPQPSGASIASVQANAAIMTSSIAAAPAEPPLYRRANRRRARMTEAVPTPPTVN